MRRLVYLLALLALMVGAMLAMMGALSYGENHRCQYLHTHNAPQWELDQYCAH